MTRRAMKPVKAWAVLNPGGTIRHVGYILTDMLAIYAEKKYAISDHINPRVVPVTITLSKPRKRKTK